jgi:hypothetical protein
MTFPFSKHSKHVAPRANARAWYRFHGSPHCRAVGQMTRNDNRYEMWLYLRWLEKRGLTGPFTAEELKGDHIISLLSQC